MQHHKNLALAIGSIGLLTLSACSSTESTGATESPIASQTTETVVASETETVQYTTEVVETSTEETTAANLDEPVDNTTLPYSGIGIGSPISLNNEDATVCIYGDGYGTNVWAAGENTSCEFVSAVHHKLVDGLNPTTDNIRNHLPATVTATSPVTGETYDLTCSPRGDALVSCRGGNNASVHFY
ncbi:hypothetical protein [Corynebacterium glutamicum]|uniref:hypothetical protein n=1 Tax=Corynebacterium glutamicum TaxID=1718 RepID=UPI0009420BAC|nr:hypothetical protein [Corynebacterium glutamicum]OKX84309.1 hypothetical protein AUO95_03620 [Corynebacterium glutamicum]